MDGGNFGTGNFMMNPWMSYILPLLMGGGNAGGNPWGGMGMMNPWAPLFAQMIPPLPANQLQSTPSIGQIPAPTPQTPLPLPTQLNAATGLPVGQAPPPPPAGGAPSAPPAPGTPLTMDQLAKVLGVAPAYQSLINLDRWQGRLPTMQEAQQYMAQSGGFGGQGGRDNMQVKGFDFGAAPGRDAPRGGPDDPRN